MDETAWPVLLGERCALAVVSLHDAEAWKAGEDPEQRRWFAFPAPAPMENVVAAISNWRDNWRTDGPIRHWGIWRNGHLAGGVELRDLSKRRSNVSYVVFPAFRRQGFATEAICLATEWGFGNRPIDVFVAVTHEENAASRATAERSGFRLEGPAERREYDEPGPCVRYVLSRPQHSPGPS